MDHVYWERIEQIFNAAVERPIGERDAFVRQMCGHDPALAADVRMLLDADRMADETVKRAVEVHAVDLLAETRAAAWIGRRVGVWRVTRIIGEGGAGIVLLGVRDDGRFDQTVAIKVMRVGLGSSEAIARFRRERRLLAQLEHPHIARLFDGGEIKGDGLTEDVPYIVMEHVEGKTITSHYRHATASVRDKLTAFLQVLDAVAYAHRRLVLHRDLKPENILVTESGTAKLLDFGVAQLQSDDDGIPKPVAPLGMTVEYASPEQIAGSALSVESDIYSLGVVLYELLGGRHPYASHATATTDVVAAVHGGRVAPLGVNVDVDAIVAKAMHTTAAGRYHTVEAFADDIHAYLDARPIVARSVPLWDRASLFVHRNQWQVAAAVVLCVAITAGVIGTAYEAHRANRRVLQLRQLAGALLFQVHDAVEALPGSTAAREVLVKTSAEHLDRLADDAGSDPRFLLEMATAYERLAQLQGGPNAGHIGRTADAAESYHKALALYDRLAPPHARDVLLREAGCWKKLGRMQQLNGDTKSATESLRRALEYGERAVTPGEPLPIELIDTYSSLGDLMLDVGAARDALTLYMKARDNFERAIPPTSDAKQQRVLVNANVRVGQAQVWLGDLEGARAAYEHALAVARPIAARDRNNAVARRDVAIIMDRLAQVIGDPESPNLGDARTAAAMYAEMIPEVTALATLDPHNVRAARDVVEFHGSLADCLREEHPAAAVREYTTALGLYAALPESYRRTASVERWQAARERGLGLALEALGQHDAALAHLRKVVPTFQALTDTDGHPGARQDLGTTLRYLAAVEAAGGDIAAAERDAARAVALLDEEFRQHGSDVSVRADLDEARRLMDCIKLPPNTGGPRAVVVQGCGRSRRPGGG